MNTSSASKKTVLMISATPLFLDRGTPIRIVEQAAALQARGHRVEIVCPPGGSPKLPRGMSLSIHRLPAMFGSEEFVRPGPSIRKAFYDVVLVPYTWKLLRTIRPDILHGHNHEGLLIGAIARWLLRITNRKSIPRLVGDLHGSFSTEMRAYGWARGFVQRFFSVIETWIDRCADLLVTSSEENTEQLRVRSPHQPITFVPDGVAIDAFKNLPSKHDLRKQFGIDTTVVVIGYTGAFTEDKGFPLLLSALENVLSEDSSAHVIIGGFPDDHVREWVQHQKFKDRFRIISPLYYDDVPRLLATCDIAADPKNSLTQQSSGKILNYMAAGLPIVCFDRPTNRAYVGDGAQYAVSESADALAEAIKILCQNVSLRTQMGEENRLRALNWTWAHTAATLEQVYPPSSRRTSGLR
ncbi:MAG: glycosyltransferase family 4 protein [Candidatus Kerfeldbacteria bacterium]|nr:glycosyltransferase family 4 protein [Candidatus Kerfeldbacteria bacterium]